MSNIRANLKNAALGLLDFVLPPACQLCSTRLAPYDKGICAGCRGSLPQLPSPHCSRCALPFITLSGPDHLCQACLQDHRPAYSKVHCFGLHEGNLRSAIHRFKFRNDISLERLLADLMLSAIPPEALLQVDTIVPVPLHATRLRQRTYNQSLLLARGLARRTGITLDYRSLRRIRHTAAQQELPAAERKRNLAGSLQLSGDLGKRNILLVDDVMTTGATIRECARTLRRGQCGTIQVAILARASVQ